MSKGFIDLGRANSPQNVVGEEAPKTNTTKKPAAQRQPREPKIAMANTAVTPSEPTRATMPTSQPASVERQSTIGARIPESLHQTIRVFCIANRIEMQQFVQDALTKHLADLQAPQA